MKLFTGSVFQFYVPEIKKFAFCKFFNFRHLSDFHGLLAQVYNCFSDDGRNSLEELNKCDWLFGARSMHRWPNTRKGSGWKYLGIISSPLDNNVPDFKGTRSSPYIVEDESKIERWYIVRNLTESIDCQYDKVKHLETKILTTTSLMLPWRTGMEYCRINNLEVRKYYDLNDEGIRYMYWQMINIPIYSEIPLEIRGKGLC
jgi:hypothetical protein